MSAVGLGRVKRGFTQPGSEADINPFRSSLLYPAVGADAVHAESLVDPVNPRRCLWRLLGLLDEILANMRIPRDFCRKGYSTARADKARSTPETSRAGR